MTPFTDATLFLIFLITMGIVPDLIPHDWIRRLSR